MENARNAGVMRAETASALDGLDVLVNNAGIARQARFEDVADNEWDAYWQLNVMSYVRTIRAALPHLRDANAAAIVNVSSTAGKRPSTGMPHYSVTKAADRDRCLARRGWPRRAAGRGARRGPGQGRCR